MRMSIFDGMPANVDVVVDQLILKFRAQPFPTAGLTVSSSKMLKLQTIWNKRVQTSPLRL